MGMSNGNVDKETMDDKCRCDVGAEGKENNNGALIKYIIYLLLHAAPFVLSLAVRLLTSSFLSHPRARYCFFVATISKQ